jgi:VIT1/CCC1 family predicted Fe2+/Mn2+ transporter
MWAQHSVRTEKRNVRRENRRTSRQREAFQAYVVGINDGLISTLALLLGVVGAGSGAEVVRVAGLASLVAGACSLAASQYIASQTQIERGERAKEPSSALRTAFSTLWASALGASVPIVPWFFLSGIHAIASSLVAAGVAAMIIGARLSEMNDCTWIRGALRQLGLVLLTAAVTFGIGRILQRFGA